MTVAHIVDSDELLKIAQSKSISTEAICPENMQIIFCIFLQSLSFLP